MIMTKIGVVVIAAAAGTASFASPALAVAPPGPVSSIPADLTPQLATSGTDGSVEQVRKLVQCGNTMYAVGRFGAIKSGRTTYMRSNVFSFRATSPFTVTRWQPRVNGQINSVALSSDCSMAYLGGSSTSINDTPVRNIAAVDTSTGALIPSFGHNAGGQVETLLLYKGHLLTGGYFTSINGVHRPYLASLSPTTGRVGTYLNINISGKYPGDSNATRVYNGQLSNHGNRLLVEGDFTSVGSQHREQISMLNLTATTARLANWTSKGFYQHCGAIEPFYIQAASWSPDDSMVYTAATGYKPSSGPGSNKSDPRAGLCDAAAAFPATEPGSAGPRR